MKKYILTGLICLFSFSWIRGQEYIPQITHRHYISDTTLFHPRHPWKAALETFGLNMLVWGFDRYLVKEDWAYINGHTIKSNFKNIRYGIPTSSRQTFSPIPTTVRSISTQPAATA